MYAKYANKRIHRTASTILYGIGTVVYTLVHPAEGNRAGNEETHLGNLPL